MHEGCKGCRDENTLCDKKYIEAICPCSICLVKPMCVSSCDPLRVFIAENLEELKCIHSKMVNKKRITKGKYYE